MKMLVLDRRPVKKNGTRFPNPTMYPRLWPLTPSPWSFSPFQPPPHHPRSPPVVTAQPSSPASPSGPPPPQSSSDPSSREPRLSSAALLPFGRFILHLCSLFALSFSVFLGFPAGNPHRYYFKSLKTLSKTEKDH